ncbi:cyclin-domain-containing protein [Microthyrium microscopicum]|uniref:Cyclin-domain-containing protein n=1 Tax=Microthyrium microscopicum TaxID=703497 RepID=A0A6A6UK74_9PEZI|nr:cyclin-domain-containing protein [Microthyrium microscopicum]
MGSIVEVRHAFPHTMGGDQNPHQAPHRSAPLRATQTDSSSSASTVRPMNQDDTPMTDVFPAPTQPERPVAATRHTFQAGTREIAFHGAGASQPATRVNPVPALKTEPSVQASPVHAQSHPPSASLRGVHSSSVTSSLQNSPIRSAQTQSPNSYPSPPSPPRIKVKSLSHIQSFVIDDANPLSPSRSTSRIASSGGRDLSPQYEISEMPVAEIIEMVAGLLTKITSTNDRQHEYLHNSSQSADERNLNQQATSVLAFHGKNVPSISILSYLSRIHKYCPTTYEVFLSLLVYFDRMTERVNSGPMQSLRQANQISLERNSFSAASAVVPTELRSSAIATEPRSIPQHTPPSSGSFGKPQQSITASSALMPPSPPIPVYPSPAQEPANLSHFFVVDSFNVHRLVIAGVTCASKFFSDIFYTNSRYAKVGGLPLAELNHLELQFLLLNDFRLAVPLEEMEAYGTMLVEFYAREVLAQQSSSARP